MHTGINSLLTVFSIMAAVTTDLQGIELQKNVILRDVGLLNDKCNTPVEHGHSVNFLPVPHFRCKIWTDRTKARLEQYLMQQ